MKKSELAGAGKICGVTRRPLGMKKSAYTKIAVAAQSRHRLMKKKSLSIQVAKQSRHPVIKKSSLPLEVYFLKYAFPCSFITLQRGRISQKEFDEMEKAALEDKVLERKYLEKIFTPAFRRMKKLAEKKGMKVWSKKLMREYYWKHHNEIIDKRQESYRYAPAVLRDLCRIVSGVVKGMKGKYFLVLLETGKIRPVMSLCGDLTTGERVMVHYGYACECL